MFNNENEIIYEGEFLNGKRVGYGKGKLYDNLDESVIYEGKFLNWRKNGLGKEYNDDELIFEGLFKNRKIER